MPDQQTRRDWQSHIAECTSTTTATTTITHSVITPSLGAPTTPRDSEMRTPQEPSHGARVAGATITWSWSWLNRNINHAYAVRGMGNPPVPPMPPLLPKPVPPKPVPPKPVAPTSLPVVTPAAPHITAHPAKSTRSRTASFRFTDSTKGVRFQARFDNKKTYHFTGKPAKYSQYYKRPTFSVRATTNGKTTEVASFTWTVHR